MARKLHDKLLTALQERSVWAERQALYYEMRHQGIPRRNKPFKGAADLHLPLADNAVEKLKPYYVNSIFGRQRLASFTALRQQQKNATSGAADYLDWQIRNRSNYELQANYVIDLMAVSGPPVLKCYWNRKAANGKGGLCFEAVDPLFFIVPPRGDEIDEMDFFAHVQQISVAKFERDGRYSADKDLLAKIRGGAKQVEEWKDEEKAGREGITHSDDEDEIVLFEAWERVKEGWRVRTYSPSAPDEPVRQDMICNYRMGGEPMQPFIRWRMEITEKGFYAPRSIVEKVAPYETYGTKLWNNKADWMEYAMKPLFTRDPQAALTNTGNVTLRPGEILPPGVSPASMPEPPFALDNEMAFTRQLAEERAGTPDFGVTDESGKQGDNRTAAEVNLVGSFASQGIQMKARICAMSEGETYRKAWALVVQFGGNNLTYYQADEMKVLPQQALHDDYLIAPDAVPDQWDQQQRMGRAVARFNMHKGNPNVNQEELTKSVLEADDPRLVKKLFVSNGSKAANESEDEAIEIGILLEGFPAAVNPGEDHVTRLRMLFGKLQQLSLMPLPATQEEFARQQMGKTRMQEHIMQHLQHLQQENPALAKQMVAAIGQLDPGQQVGGAAATALPGGQTETLSLSPPAGAPGVVAGSQGPAVSRNGRMGGLPGAAGQSSLPEAMAV